MAWSTIANVGRLPVASPLVNRASARAAVTTGVGVGIAVPPSYDSQESGPRFLRPRPSNRANPGTARTVQPP